MALTDTAKTTTITGKSTLTINGEETTVINFNAFSKSDNSLNVTAAIGDVSLYSANSSDCKADVTSFFNYIDTQITGSSS